MPGARRLVVNVSTAILLGPAVRVTAKRWYHLRRLTCARQLNMSHVHWAPRDAPQVSPALQDGELIRDAGRAGQLGCLADLAQTGRIPAASGMGRILRAGGRHLREDEPATPRIVDNAIPSNACWVDPPSSPSEAMARDSTGGVLGMPVKVKDPIRLLRRIAVAVTGTVILAIGVVLLVAPGPGLVVIALALAVFAIEFQWARRNLAAVQARARSAALKAAASRVATASAVLFGVGAIGLGAVSVFTDLLPLSGAGTGVGVAVGGLTVLLTTAYGVRELRNAKKAQEDGDAE